MRDPALRRLLAGALCAMALCACQAMPRVSTSEPPPSAAPGHPFTQAAPGISLAASLRTDSCTAPATRYCASCTAFCGCPQNQSAVCERGVDVETHESGGGRCLKPAACSCQ